MLFRSDLGTSLTGPINDALVVMNDRIEAVFQLTAGRWKIENYQMIFFKDDNTTEVCRFDLFDENGNPSMDAIFDRRKVV